MDRLAQERLGALPPAERWAKYRFEPRKASRDGFVSYDGIRYGVPWRFSGHEVKVREVHGFVEIYHEKQLRNLQIFTPWVQRFLGRRKKAANEICKPLFLGGFLSIINL
jgi:hypothetical protein